jgi:DNA-directed RNA polymerase specialized sigma24 family protein
VAIILNKYEQKRYEDIAAILDCSTMAVKSLLSRARSNLRAALMRYIHIE